ncbi:MAG: hypothetical protein LAO79_06425 [Acidobacteriia bacterium]|nr:hypothetical protein [Terriglobia bacterium]
MDFVAGCSAFLLLGVSGFAQESLAHKAVNDIAALASQPALGSWPKEKVELADYKTDHPYEVDYRRANQYCAASMDGQRVALFFVPAITTLPEKQDPKLTRLCRMHAIWIQTALGPIDVLIAELTAVWGAPNGTSAEPDIRGWKLWKNIKSWRRGAIDIWLAQDASHVILYARRNFPHDAESYFGLLSPAVKNEAVRAAARMASEDPSLTAEMLARTQCETRQAPVESVGATAGRLKQWLDGAHDRAAALIVADAYVSCAPPSDRLRSLGAKFRPICPQDGPVYAHNFLDDAEAELAVILNLANPCLLKGRDGWPDRAIERGEQFLREFPASEWVPWIEFAVARAHAIKLAGPIGDDPGQTTPLTSAAARQERSAAIEQFRRFLAAKPDAPESLFARQEAWRLFAGLPPSPIHFGCGCE